MKRSTFLVLMAVGLVARLIGLSAWGTFDNEVQKAWAARAAENGLSGIYGPPDSELIDAAEKKGRSILAVDIPWTEWEWCGGSYTVDYPPGSLLVLWMAGKLFRLFDTQRVNGPLFNVAINLAPLLGGIAIAVLLWRSAPMSFGRTRALAFWINPAVILAAPYHGYQDTIFGAFALAGTHALWRRRHTLATVLITVSILVKPQGALLLPTLLAVLLRETRPRVWLKAALASIASAALLLSPWWSRGHIISAIAGGLRPFSQVTLAAQGFNVWWIVGWIMDRMTHAPGVLARIVLISEFRAWAGWDPRFVARLIVAAAAIGIAVFVTRRLPQNRHVIPLSIVVMVHAYSLFGTAVHENHAFLAVMISPLLLNAWPRGRAIVVMTSSFLFLNLFLTFGLGRRLTRLAWVASVRALPGFDWSLLVALFQVILVALLVFWMRRRPEDEEKDIP